MKEYFVTNSLNLINSKYNYNQDMLDRVKYGLEIIYITISKLSVIFITSLIFKAFKETFIFFCFISLIKIFSYGLHAKKSWQCYIASLIIFIILPKIFINYNFSEIHKIIFCTLSIASMILFAPADTHKRPLVNKKQRIKLKIICISTCCIYSVICLLSTNIYVINLSILAMIVQSISINPITYKIFKMPYNNYKVYIKNGV